MKYLVNLIILFGFMGCKTTTPDWGKYRGISPHSHTRYNDRIEQEQLDDPSFRLKVEEEAKMQGLRYVDFLHSINSGKLRLVSVSRDE